MTGVIRARGLSKAYGSARALDGIDLDVESGRVVGLIGPNGAGKTTALKAMLGLTSYSGELSVLGRDPYRERAELMREVCFIADVATLPRWIRVAQLLDYVEAVHPSFDRERAEELLARTEIRPDRRVRQLSKGMIVQLHLAIVMAVDARLLVLDEPTLGLDILYRKRFYDNLLNEYFDHERTIIVTTHQVEEIEHILTDLVFIQHGRIVLSDGMDAIAERFVEVLVTPDQSATAQALGPIHSRKVFGRNLFLFENVDRDRLAGFGELHTPSVADLFVAKMEEVAA